jgi:WhiB family redox-sensing transcriptional regulator
MHQPADQHWRDEALCAQTDPEIFFPEPGQSPHAAKQVCAECPVRVECLTDALDHRDIAFGVRGGLTPTQRRELLHRDARRAA